MHKHLILHWVSQSIKVIWERNPDSVLLKLCFMKTRLSFCSRAAAEIAAAIAVLEVRFVGWKLPQRRCPQRSKTSNSLPPNTLSTARTTNTQQGKGVNEPSTSLPVVSKQSNPRMQRKSHPDCQGTFTEVKWGAGSWGQRGGFCPHACQEAGLQVRRDHYNPL